MSTLPDVRREANALVRTIDVLNVAREGFAGDEPSSLLDVLRGHGELLDHIAVADERRVRAVIVELLAVVEEHDVDRAVELLNAVMKRYCAPPQLMRHDGWPWHMHIDRGDDEPLHRWFGATGSFALANALAGRSTVPWGVCAADGCDRVFVHDDRGATRHYCSVACGNRVRVARHRARR